MQPRRTDNRGGDVAHVDWDTIKTEYLRGGASYRKLAAKYGVSFSTLEKRARSEKWSAQRREVSEKAATKARQKIITQRAREIELLDESRSLLIQKLNKSIAKFPDIPGNRMKQSVAELVSDTSTSDSEPKKPGKHKIVQFESDLLKMVTALEKLMEMSGYFVGGGEENDDGFIDALNSTALEVNEFEADIPEDMEQ